MSRYFSRSILVLAVVGLSACSLFNRHNDRANEDGKVASPLDTPVKSADAAPASEASGDASSNGPTVTLMKKDGTVIENGKPADGEGKPGNTPVTSEMVTEKKADATVAATPSEDAVTHKDQADHADIVKAEQAEHKTWGYTGETGPEHWAGMNADYASCQSGQMQSPIDLKWHKPVKGGSVAVAFKPAKAFVSDNGHAIQVGFDSAGHVKFKGKTYELTQAHFHSPSEHTLSGKQFPLEVHFVNKDADGKMLVLAAFYNEGKENPVVAKIWNAIPNPPAPASSNDLQLNTHEMLPPMKTYYEYKGSLTVPPCTEDVQWVVFNSPMSVSKAQIEALHHFHDGNARPTQSLNGRKVVNH